MINESKTKYMKRKRNITNLEQDLIMNGQEFELVRNKRYLGAMTNSKNLVSDEIKSRIAAINRCFYGLRQIFRSTVVRKAVKIEIYKTKVKPVVVLGRETWAMAVMVMTRLVAWGGG